MLGQPPGVGRPKKIHVLVSHEARARSQALASRGLGQPGRAGAIRGDLDQTQVAFAAAPVLAVLGAVLFGFAVMSFVAAHWTGMSKLARLALLIGALWACYGGAALLFQRQLAPLRTPAVLGGIAVYGASIMLIAQMYHMEGNPADAVLLWALGALLAAVLAGSPRGPGCHLRASDRLVRMGTPPQRERPLYFSAALGRAALTAAWLALASGLPPRGAEPPLWLVPLGFLVWGHHAHWLVVLIGGAVARRQRPLGTRHSTGICPLGRALRLRPCRCLCRAFHSPVPG